MRKLLVVWIALAPLFALAQAQRRASGGIEQLQERHRLVREGLARRLRSMGGHATAPGLQVPAGLVKSRPMAGVQSTQQIITRPRQAQYFEQTDSSAPFRRAGTMHFEYMLDGSVPYQNSFVLLDATGDTIEQQAILSFKGKVLGQKYVYGDSILMDMHRDSITGDILGAGLTQSYNHLAYQTNQVLDSTATLNYNLGIKTVRRYFINAAGLADSIHSLTKDIDNGGPFISLTKEFYAYRLDARGRITEQVTRWRGYDPNTGAPTMLDYAFKETYEYLGPTTSERLKVREAREEESAGQFYLRSDVVRAFADTTELNERLLYENRRRKFDLTGPFQDFTFARIYIDNDTVVTISHDSMPSQGGLRDLRKDILFHNDSLTYTATFPLNVHTLQPVAMFNGSRTNFTYNNWDAPEPRSVKSIIYTDRPFPSAPPDTLNIEENIYQFTPSGDWQQLDILNYGYRNRRMIISSRQRFVYADYLRFDVTAARPAVGRLAARLYPSPAGAGRPLTLALPRSAGADYALHDLSGRIIRQGSVSGLSAQIEAPAQPGVYVLTVRQGAEQAAFRVVVEGN